ncbi:MAG TPA: DUF1840 domain-containing protein [Paucimonas sp.]|nr:DUF1840 domain-containing protein [Paucimonas sp.]
MLITFKSKAAAEVMMYEQHAKRILDLFGKDIQRGVITAAETPIVISRLEAEIAESKAHPVSDEVRHDIETHIDPEGEFDEHEESQIVTFATRAYPLLEMLRAARATGSDVMWGV